MLNCLLITLQWYVSTIIVPKSVLLIIHLTNTKMESLMKLTSVVLVETLSDSDYIMVYVFNKKCTVDFAPANSLQRQLIEKCILMTDVTSEGINSNAVCKEIKLWY